MGIDPPAEYAKILPGDSLKESYTNRVTNLTFLLGSV
jgi:hypothetical protein